MKIKFKKILTFILCLPLVFCGGCLFYDENSDHIESSSILGYKVCYNDNNYQVDDTYEIFATHILTELYANFGIVNDSNHSSNLTDKVKTDNAVNYDRIRHQLVESGDEPTFVEKAWKWTLATNLTNATICTNTENIITHYSNLELQTAYYDAFINTYKIPLAIVCLQISMGIAPTEFTINLANDNQTVYMDSSKNTLADSTALTNIKTEFKTKGVYVGFKEQDCDTFKNYIIQNIIGNEIINTIYDRNIVTNSATKTYDSIISSILELNTVGLEKSFYEPYPASVVKDVTNTDLYIKSSGDALGHIDAYEYNSIVVMTKKECSIATLFLCMEAEQELNITIKVKIYNNSNVTEVGSYTKKLLANKNSGIFMVDMKAQKVGVFNNDISNGNLKASTPKYINNANKNSSFFKINASNISILDSTKIGSSYFEFSFEIAESTNAYTPFKVGIYDNKVM